MHIVVFARKALKLFSGEAKRRRMQRDQMRSAMRRGCCVSRRCASSQRGNSGSLNARVQLSVLQPLVDPKSNVAAGSFHRRIQQLVLRAGHNGSSSREKSISASGPPPGRIQRAASYPCRALWRITPEDSTRRNRHRSPAFGIERASSHAPYPPSERPVR